MVANHRPVGITTTQLPPTECDRSIGPVGKNAHLDMHMSHFLPEGRVANESQKEMCEGFRQLPFVRYDGQKQNVA